MFRAFVVALACSIVFAASTVAQGPSAGIQATGTGVASAPAETAHVQILLGSSAAYGLGPVEMGMMEMPAGTPSAVMPQMGPMGMMGVSEDQLGPVIDAMADAGIGEDTIAVTVPSSNQFFGPGGPETAELRVAIDQPTGENLIALVAAIHAAAATSGLTVLHVGARYEAADCAALTQEAREAAIADASQRAEGLAQGLGVTLGELVLASEMPYYGPTGAESCLPAGTEASFGPYGPGTDPAFDPNATEAMVTIQVTLTYAFEAAA